MRRLAFAFAAALGACAQLPVSTDAIMREAVELARAPGAEQQAALARAQQALREDPGPLQRVRLAALLATLPPPLRDDARAAELVQPVADPASPGAGRFAAFLATQLAERRRLAREIERLEREAERLAKERASLERERQNADRERDKREEALRQQIEALRTIERGILEREERLRRKQGAKP